jgi:quercetin dioxygenase-like cupin family protein
MSQDTNTKGVAAGAALPLSSLVPATTQGIASRVLLKTIGGNATLFTFDAGEGLTEHSSPMEALAVVLEGTCRFVVGGADVRAVGSTVVRLPAGVPHEVEAIDATRFLLIMLRSTLP